jgi:putative addiction module killer protein
MSNILYNEAKDFLESMYKLIKTPEFEEWYDEQPLKSKFQIDDRLSNIESAGHFGVHKELTDEVSELKWDNGRRVYYAYLAKQNILLLLGGNKNGQDKDIRKAKKIFRKYTEEDTSA